MKKILFVAMLSFFIVSGCQQREVANVDCFRETDENHVLFIAGKWQGQGTNWMLHLATDGNIPEVVRQEGLRMILSEEGTQMQSPDNKLFVNYTYGKCFWSYDSDANNLKATVTLDNYFVDADGAILSCSMVDEFEGPVSADKNTWTANWKTITTFDPFSSPSDSKMAPEITTGRKLVFEKLP